jgi:hypothetical protein
MVLTIRRPVDLTRLFFQMAFNESHLLRAGFPHSDICGSMLVCQLPAAFRRLPRPSSPVIAKASTTCTYSLDPITLTPRGDLPRRPKPQAFFFQRLCCSYFTPNSQCKAGDTYNLNPSMPFKLQMTWLYFFHFVKEQTAPGFIKNQNQANVPFAWF